VCARDAFGNRCSKLPSPAIRCKLICTSSDGTPTFVEARDPVAVLPFVQSYMPPVPLPKDMKSSPSPAASVDSQSCQQLSSLNMFRPDASATAAASTNATASVTATASDAAVASATATISDADTSFTGEVDIGRYCHAIHHC
jgi:hypothetical protein